MEINNIKSNYMDLFCVNGKFSETQAKKSLAFYACKYVHHSVSFSLKTSKEYYSYLFVINKFLQCIGIGKDFKVCYELLESSYLPFDPSTLRNLYLDPERIEFLSTRILNEAEKKNLEKEAENLFKFHNRAESI